MAPPAKIAELADEAKRNNDATRLAHLAEHPSKSVRIAVAGNSSADDGTVGRLLADSNPVVRLAAASNLGGRPLLQTSALASDDARVRANLAYTFLWDPARSLPRDVQEALAADEAVECRCRIAETTDQLDIFVRLLADPDSKVRAYSARNPRITRDQMERLVTDRIATVRASAAGGGVLYPDDDQLLRLARDRSANVRWAVLFRVDVPRAALEAIAEDPDELNRRHAQSALRDPLAIRSEQAAESIRSARRTAADLQPFRVH